MDLKNAFIALLVFSTIIIGVVNYSTELGAKSGSTKAVREVEQNTFIGRIENTTKRISSTLATTQLTGNVAEIPFLLVTGAYNILKIILSDLPDLFSTLIDALIFYLYLPNFFAAFLKAVFAFAVTIAILNAILKWNL